jgi:hypothetical protein
LLEDIILRAFRLEDFSSDSEDYTMATTSGTTQVGAGTNVVVTSIRGLEDLDLVATKATAQGASGSSGRTSFDRKLKKLTTPESQKLIGQIVKLYSDVDSKAIIDALATADGMTGDRYRELIFQEVDKYLTAKNYDWEDKLLFLMIFAGAFGIAKQTKRILAALAPASTGMFADLKDFIATRCKTYVNDGDTSVGRHPIPTVKVPDSLPDFALLGVLFLHCSFLKTFDENTIKDWASLPGFLRRQFMGNFALSEEFQDDHETWEFDLWDRQINKTNNTKVATYEPGYHKNYYANRRADSFPLRYINMEAVDKPRNGYTYKDFTVIVADFKKEVVSKM